MDNLTIKEARELVSMFSAAPPRTRPEPSGRAVVVVDRGWIFAGDMSVTPDGYLRLTNALHVFRWQSVGFSGLVADPAKAKADLRPVADVEIPMDAIVFRVPVPADWGTR
jgi:hypothetical protein